MNQSILSQKLVSANLLIIKQLVEALNKLDALSFTRPPEGELGGTIGMHFRHVIEFYKELVKVIKADEVDSLLCYDNRQRDLKLETSIEDSIETLESLAMDLKSSPEADRVFTLRSLLEVGQPMVDLPTSLFRELQYVLEHSVHHMAIIKMLAEQMNVSLDSNFGVATATQDYHKKTA